MSGARKILVMGLGNPDRGDDGIGPMVAHALAGRVPSGVRVAARGGDMLSLIDEWDGVELLVCIDAAEPAGTPGRIRRIDLATESLPPERGASSHAFGLAEAIALARALGTAPARIAVYAVEGSDFAVGAEMTPPVAAAVQDVADRVLAELAEMVAHA